MHAKCSGHRALFVPDILLDIIGLLSSGQATQTARVCKAWLGISLDVVWKGPVPLQSLIGVLAPLALQAVTDSVVIASFSCEYGPCTYFLCSGLHKRTGRSGEAAISLLRFANSIRWHSSFPAWPPHDRCINVDLAPQTSTSQTQTCHMHDDCTLIPRRSKLLPP